MAFPHFTTRQLDAYVAVAQLRSFGAAAERLALTTSAVSQLIAELEEVVGFRLFDRSTRRVALSAAGRDFLEPAQAVLRQMALASRAAEDLRSHASGLVRVAAPLAIAATILPAAIEAFARERPKVVVHIQDTTVERLCDAVVNTEVDFGIGPDRAVGNAVVRTTLFASPWVLWCAPSHALARQDPVRWPQLRDHPLVAAGRDHESGVAQMHHDLPDDERITPMEIVEHVTTALGLTACGLKATLGPAYVNGLAQSLGLVMRRIVEPEIQRAVCLYRPARRTASPAAQTFAEFLAQWLGQWSASQPWHGPVCPGLGVSAGAAPR
ncbi:LysR family transcriptional regulator [Azohydromonas lata]|uniref:LysR substrate-binding domain-containing protein n=1 Tax=Azohydromonas lata TaxID=45677 RepID=A0ABU5IHC8_9BURK|nr:LysR substrate-binding domain-containing protein [Azohydromonas lata]MDZ5457338.1 LysR substrate-binding domain-containing protein [Azohydromonas lata]